MKDYINSRVSLYYYITKYLWKVVIDLTLLKVLIVVRNTTVFIINFLQIVVLNIIFKWDELAKSGFKLGISHFDTVLNYHLS
jgi:hypothetical protein